MRSGASGSESISYASGGGGFQLQRPHRRLRGIRFIRSGALPHRPRATTGHASPRTSLHPRRLCKTRRVHQRAALKIAPRACGAAHVRAHQRIPSLNRDAGPLSHRYVPRRPRPRCPCHPRCGATWTRATIQHPYTARFLQLPAQSAPLVTSRVYERRLVLLCCSCSCGRPV